MTTLKHDVHVPAPHRLTTELKSRLEDLYGSVFFSSYESSKRNAVKNLFAELTSFDYQQRKPAVATLTDELFAAICEVFLDGTPTHSEILLELLPFVVSRRDIVFSSLNLPTGHLRAETLELNTPDETPDSFLPPANDIRASLIKGLGAFRSSIDTSFDFSFRLFSQLDLDITDDQKSALRQYVANSLETQPGILLGLLVNPTHRFTLEDFRLTHEKIQSNAKLQQALINGICTSDSPLSLLDSILGKAESAITDKDRFNVKDFIFQHVGDITVAIITKELQRSLPIADKLTFITKTLNYFKPHIEDFIKQIDLSNNPEYSYNKLRQICMLLSNPMVCNLLTLSPDSMEKLVSIAEQLKSNLQFANNNSWAQLSGSLIGSLDFYAALNADANTNVGDTNKFNALLSDPAAYTAIKKEIDEHRDNIRQHILTQYLGSTVPPENLKRNKIEKLAYLVVSDPDLWKQLNPYQYYSGFTVFLYNVFGVFKEIFDPNNPNSEVSKLKGLHNSFAAKFDLDTPTAASASPRQHSPGRSSSPRRPIISPQLPTIPPPSQPVSPRSASTSSVTSSSGQDSGDEADKKPTLGKPPVARQEGDGTLLTAAVANAEVLDAEKEGEHDGSQSQADRTESAGDHSLHTPARSAMLQAAPPPTSSYGQAHAAMMHQSGRSASSPLPAQPPTAKNSPMPLPTPPRNGQALVMDDLLPLPTPPGKENPTDGENSSLDERPSPPPRQDGGHLLQVKGKSSTAKRILDIQEVSSTEDIATNAQKTADGPRGP